MAWNTDRTPRFNRKCKEYTIAEALNKVYMPRFSSKGYNAIVSFPKCLAGKRLKVALVDTKKGGI